MKSLDFFLVSYKTDLENPNINHNITLMFLLFQILNVNERTEKKKILISPIKETVPYSFYLFANAQLYLQYLIYF